MVERLLFNRVDAESAGTAIGREHDLVVLARPNEAQPALPLAQFAEARANIALNAAVIDFVPIFCRDVGHIRSVSEDAEAKSQQADHSLPFNFDV